MALGLYAESAIFVTGCRQLEVRSDTGLTALDVAQTDEMRAVLTSTAQHDNMTPLPACRAKPDSQGTY